MNFPRINRKTLSVVFAATLVVGSLGIWGSNARIRASASERIFQETANVPTRKTALLLGCSEYLNDGRENLFFKHRIKATSQMFEAGKIHSIIVSGDNSRKDYDESTDMMNALVRAGIPKRAIFRDFAGFSTLDSVVRAKEIFGQTEITVISQEFHIERAIYIGQVRGIDVLGFAAKNVEGMAGRKTHIREYLARCKAILDLQILNRQPRFLGERIAIN